MDLCWWVGVFGLVGRFGWGLVGVYCRLLWVLFR